LTQKVAPLPSGRQMSQTMTSGRSFSAWSASARVAQPVTAVAAPRQVTADQLAGRRFVFDDDHRDGHGFPPRKSLPAG
jgi:hypothetical protein